MTKRISWKKGMRLTDEILTASDACVYHFVDSAFELAAAGRFGLFPSPSRKFCISLSANKNFVDVEAIDCLAIAKGGRLIDLEYDTLYSNTFDTRVAIPDVDVSRLLLVVTAKDDEWHDTNDGYCEPVYTFSLVPENLPLPDNSLPIARLVNEYGWRVDDVDFVPPCLYVTAHQYYVEQLKQFASILHSISEKLERSIESDCKVAIGVFWPVVQQLAITIDKEVDIMTPMSFLGNVQKCVSAFVCACALDEHLSLGEPELFKNFVGTPFNYKEAWNKIKEGIGLCKSINTKIDAFNEIKTVQPEKPKIEQLPQPQPKRRGWNGREI